MIKNILTIVLLLSFQLFAQNDKHINAQTISTYTSLIDIKFITFDDSKSRSYDLDILSKKSAFYIIQLINNLDKNDKKYFAPIFFLKMAGANLKSTTQRKNFINEIFVNKDTYMGDLMLMNKVLKKKPDHQGVSSAMYNVSKQLSAEQSFDFFVQIDFTISDSMSSYGKSNHLLFDPKAIQHLSPHIKEGFQDSLRSHGWFGRGPYNRVAGQL